MPPNRIAHYVMAYIKKGAGTKIIGSYSFDIEPHTIMVFPKNIIHSTNKWTLDTTGYMLSFDESLLTEAGFPVSFLNLNKLFRLSLFPFRLANEITGNHINSLFEELDNISTSSTGTDKKLFILKLAVLITVYEKEFLGADAVIAKSSGLFDEFVELVEAKYREAHSVEYYARVLSVHPNYLNKTVRSCSGFSAKKYIVSRLIQECQYLLIATHIPIKNIAFDVGFKDSNYFSRLFKTMTGYTPQQYRNPKI